MPETTSLAKYVSGEKSLWVPYLLPPREVPEIVPETKISLALFLALEVPETWVDLWHSRVALSPLFPSRTIDFPDTFSLLFPPDTIDFPCLFSVIPRTHEHDEGAMVTINPVVRVRDLAQASDVQILPLHLSF